MYWEMTPALHLRLMSHHIQLREDLELEGAGHQFPMLRNANHP